jgi:hypothetical protein
LENQVSIPGFSKSTRSSHCAFRPRAGRPCHEGYRTVETAITAKIQSTTRSSGQPGYLGIAFAPGADGNLTVGEVNPTSPAARNWALRN